MPRALEALEASGPEEAAEQGDREDRGDLEPVPAAVADSERPLETLARPARPVLLTTPVSKHPMLKTRRVGTQHWATDD